MPNRILLKGDPIRKEGVADGVVSPGDLLEAGTLAGEVARHAGAGLNAQPKFAFEREMTGDGIDVDYVDGDQVVYGHLRTGDEVQAWVAAAAAAIVRGDALESDGAGGLRKQAVSAATAQDARASVVAYAIEDLDNSGGAERARIKVEAA